ncbi:hypothetical protein O0L34_g12845 [Tuta absoluta]|nr:hypothetical protein O0L34_g12845 [Tuta absoluta]
MAFNKAVMALSLLMAVFVVGTISFATIQIAGGRTKESSIVEHPAPDATTTGTTPTKPTTQQTTFSVNASRRLGDQLNTYVPTIHQKAETISAGTENGDDIVQSHSNYVSAAPTAPHTDKTLIVDLMPKFTVTTLMKNTTTMTVKPVSIRVFLKNLGEPPSDATSASEYKTHRAETRGKEETLHGTSYAHMESSPASSETREPIRDTDMIVPQLFSPIIPEVTLDSTKSRVEEWLKGLARRLPDLVT